MLAQGGSRTDDFIVGSGTSDTDFAPPSTAYTSEIHLVDNVVMHLGRRR